MMNNETMTEMLRRWMWWFSPALYLRLLVDWRRHPARAWISKAQFERHVPAKFRVIPWWLFPIWRDDKLVIWPTFTVWFHALRNR